MKTRVAEQPNEAWIDLADGDQLRLTVVYNKVGRPTFWIRHYYKGIGTDELKKVCFWTDIMELRPRAAAQLLAWLAGRINCSGI